MTPPGQIVLSASRRTDIPAFYMDWFMDRIRKGGFEVTNPFNRRVTQVAAAPGAVHAIVFWSKNFGPFLAGGYGDRLSEMGFHLFFNFTVNSASEILEPCLPPLADRLRQMDALCKRYGPDVMHWRFDPICFYLDETGQVRTNLGDFEAISDQAARSGVTRCITSFVDLYPKIRKRTDAMPGVDFFDPPPDVKTETLMKMARELTVKNIALSLCCEKDLLKMLPHASRIDASACIPNHRLREMFGGDISLKPDKGQRVKQGCGCRQSVDVGIYHSQPCFHRCLFCYANPSPRPKA